MKKEKVVAILDLKAFYASVECVERNLNPFTTPLAVVDAERGEGTIVLSVSPYLKSLGVPSRCRKRDLPNIDGMIYATPRMELYVHKSNHVMSIILDFITEEDLHIYSIDEAFLNIGPYLNYYKCTPEGLVKRIQKKIKDRLGLIATAGIGPNPFIAKVALDNEGKNNKDFIATWTKEDLIQKLWPIKPVSKMWGISTGIEKRLNKLGIYSIGELANADINRLKKEFGIIGEEIHNHANGIDECDIREKYIPSSKSLSLGQVLMRDYAYKEIPLLLREMVDDLSYRMRLQSKMTDRVSVGIMYSAEFNDGFNKALTLEYPTDDNDTIYKALLQLYKKHVKDQPIRRIYINFSGLDKTPYDQISLFEDEEEHIKKRKLRKTLDAIQTKYGMNSVLRSSSLLEGSTAKERHNQIGGHRK